MILLLLSFIFFGLAAICNAVMDTSNHHYSKSIFSDFKNEMWWNGEISWKNKYIDGDHTKGRVKWLFGLNKPVQLTDAFHFFKMWMIIFLAISPICAFYSCLELNGWVSALLIGAYGVTWNMLFSAFYDNVFIKK
jgi:hypothetical protein